MGLGSGTFMGHEQECAAAPDISYLGRVRDVTDGPKGKSPGGVNGERPSGPNHSRFDSGDTALKTRNAPRGQ